MKLKNAVVGQRVKLKASPHVSPRLRVGDTGTIVQTLGDEIGVQWDALTVGHDCNAHCPYGSGWYVNVEDLRKLKVDLVK